MTLMNLNSVNDPEEDTVPQDMPLIVDSHVHIFPEGIFKALWNWFDRFAWPIRYRLTSEKILEYLLSRGVGHVVAFQYAHKPGMARELNTYMVTLCQQFPGKVTGMATVFPGEKNQAEILSDAFDAGLKGVKLHAHVQCFDMNSDEMEAIYDLCTLRQKPLVMHVSREPKSDAYKCDPYVLCSAEKLERVIRNFPGLKVCVPHMGVDEYFSYQRLLHKYDTLWLDTAMAVADYFPLPNPWSLGKWRVDRVLYGTDFPNIPYAWNREINWFQEQNLPRDTLERILGKNAAALFGIDIPSNY
jgi:predicted TIM-barrel fold metal-dependent hydrolase